MRKLFIASMMTISISSAYAGVNGYTAHSRANCVNNESISWYLFNSFKGRVIAIHWHHNEITCHLDTGWQTSWRIAAVHWGEAKPGDGWAVRSWHYSPYGNTQIDAVDCYIYDGWWCDGSWCK